MSKQKTSRNGGKFKGHTTLIPAATVVADIVNRSEAVRRICPGFIQLRLSSVSGQKRVKVTKDHTYLLLTVRDTTSQQELHVYVTDPEKALADLSNGCKQKNILVTFR